MISQQLIKDPWVRLWNIKCQSLETAAKNNRFWLTSSSSWFHLGYFLPEANHLCNMFASGISLQLTYHTPWKFMVRSLLSFRDAISSAALVSGRVLLFRESDLVSNNVRQQWEGSHFAWNPLALPARMGNKSHVLFLHVQTQHVQSMCYILISNKQQNTSQEIMFISKQNKWEVWKEPKLRTS